MDRGALILIVALLAILLIPLLLSTNQETAGFEKSSAEMFILEDAKTTYGEGAEYSFLDIEKDGNNWKAELKISLQPHSKCPAILKRSYTLFPIKYREETINNRCSFGGVIIYPEEAIIASNGIQRVKDLPDTAKAYAKKYSAEEITSLKQCTNSCPEEAQFAKNLSEQKLWMVKWIASDGALFFVALDEQGKVIAQS